uniref:DUF148 domain-containing protein n=1 Tax=Heterorhabditis bacteriophora TaxID=37862 RepID=A0A1I7XBM3_HETBA
MDRELGRIEKDRQIEEIIRNESTLVQEAFMQFKADVAAQRERIKAVHREIVSQMSKEAQAADQQLHALFKNESITHKERRAKMRNIFDAMPESVRDELRSLENKEKRLGMDRPRNTFNLQIPMTYLRWGQQIGQLETRPIRVSSDDNYVEI